MIKRLRCLALWRDSPALELKFTGLEVYTSSIEISGFRVFFLIFRCVVLIVKVLKVLRVLLSYPFFKGFVLQVGSYY